MDPSTHAPTTRRGRARVLALTAAALTAVATAGAPSASAAAPDTLARHGTSDPTLGANVLVFDPSMPVADIQARVDQIHAQQVDAEMSTDRYALLFLPGEYGTPEQPLQMKVGYYTEVAGLGGSPSDVVVHGKIETYNRCLNPDPANPNCIALVNFWRTLSNLTLDIDGTGQDDCRRTANFWAVSQAVSVRRVDVRADEGDPGFSLMDYCTAGPQYASGGFIADSRFGDVTNGSQQQWLTRNSVVRSWSNGVWNQVFSGVEGAPDDSEFPNPPYTTLDETPLSREKPYLYVDQRGRWHVRVPQAREGTRGISWADGMTPGRSVPLRDFHVAKPGDRIQTINAQLARGKHLLLTPGVYDVARSIEVKRPGTVVLGLGHATLTSAGGAVPLRVADVPGAIVAGVTIDAGPQESPVLLQVGSAPRGNGHGNGHGHGRDGQDLDRGRPGHDKGRRLDPITLSDVYFRVGGPHLGSTDVALRVDADDVLVDHTWVWRADHGVEGFTEGVNGDTERWRTNVGRTGVVVTGDDVTATGLFVEHFQQHNTVWEGERGRVVLYQNELPYDPPTQADWTEPDGTLGWAGYKVGERVREHQLWGGGVYVFNQNNPSIVTENGFEVPQRPGVRLTHVMTVNLSAGTIRHVVNGVGGQVDNSNTGTPAYVVEYPPRS
ncbi:adenylyl cyclase [Cellulomonas sp. JZ18]|uniref:glycosyl hydrolase family 28-related protein n=1 Tax=Cellulomonas sp. JZ18 TaxID=2654191 RepID=UPI0012D3B8CE|nr:glycosyl hydrolase family 28-related protein [Cellulomonas sp. JZ18]QGQ18105.1 adenylyl cyclase [Cellulomonas sp. JZ18]